MFYMVQRQKLVDALLSVLEVLLLVDDDSHTYIRFILYNARHLVQCEVEHADSQLLLSAANQI
jgi:hypothetical protein